MPSVNNAFYDTLGEAWFEADDHAVALLRAETPRKLAYARDRFARAGVGPGARVLDVACGAGLVAIPLAEAGFRVEGVDLAANALDVARRRLPPGADATFRVADALALDADEAAYDAVLLFDVVEHVEDQRRLLAEAARVVRPGGVVLVNTFNRTPLSWLLAVHGFRFVTREAPDHVHVWRLFVPPTTLTEWADAAGLDLADVRGLRPALNGGLARSVARRRVDPDFRFVETRALAVGYLAAFVKR